MLSQANITPGTPMGATLVDGGATFRTWAPRATAVYLHGTFGGIEYADLTPDRLLMKDQRGHWTGFQNGAAEGDVYKFWIVGPGSSGYKRDPYARGLGNGVTFPNCCSLLRAPNSYPWHDAGFQTPDFTDMIVYQMHIGTYAVSTPGKSSTFLDVITKIPYLNSLGVNVLQPLPVDEVEVQPSMGYNGADLFSPDVCYAVLDSEELEQHVSVINNLLAAKELPPIRAEDIASGHAQLQALVDLCHVQGIAVVFDVVYNHAGGFATATGPDDYSLYYFDRMPNNGNNNDSLYFTDQDRGTGGLSFALWNADVRQFLLNNATYYLNEFHADGFRYDEISTLLSTNRDSGWSFCRDLTDTVRYLKPRALQNAEYWPFEFNDYPKAWTDIVASTQNGGAGFDVVQHDGLRGAVRGAIASASHGQGATVSMSAIAQALGAPGVSIPWQAVTCIENHDIVKSGRDVRIPVLADPSDPRSWYARSRSRFANGILLTAPGIPQIFMGQEFLEKDQWDTAPSGPYLIDWAGVGIATGSNANGDSAMVDHLHFTRDLVALRRRYAALRGGSMRASHVNDDGRVIAFHRWLEGIGEDVLVVATLNESTWEAYTVGFPSGGYWAEVFNSDAYDNWPNPLVAGNDGGRFVSGPPLDGFATSASIVIPANGFVVFARS